MKLLLTTLIGFISVGAFAIPQKIEIDSKIFYQGTNVGSPRIITSDGKSVKVMVNDQKRQHEYNLEVLPVVHGDTVQVTYHLTVRNANNEILSHGSVDVKEDRATTVSFDKGKIKLLLKVKSS